MLSRETSCSQSTDPTQIEGTLGLYINDCWSFSLMLGPSRAVPTDQAAGESAPTMIIHTFMRATHHPCPARETGTLDWPLLRLLVSVRNVGGGWGRPSPPDEEMPAAPGRVKVRLTANLQQGPCIALKPPWIFPAPEWECQPYIAMLLVTVID